MIINMMICQVGVEFGVGVGEGSGMFLHNQWAHSSRPSKIFWTQNFFEQGQSHTVVVELSK